MKKPATKKLAVLGETLRTLEQDQLAAIAGAQRPKTSVTCTSTCETMHSCA